MVKEFEQQHEQDLAILIDPWLPKTKVTAEQRDSLEEAIKFVATLCYETCRHAGRRMTLGWSWARGPALRHGPSSIKLLHEFLEQLAMMRATAEGGLSSLLDALPPSTLREAVFVVVSTRPINLHEEAERTSRLSGASARGLLARVTLLDASRGDLTDFIKFGDTPEFASTAGRARDGREGAVEAKGPAIEHRPSPPRLDGMVGPAPFSGNGSGDRL